MTGAATHSVPYGPRPTGERRLVIVVPCYNEAEVLPEACSRLMALLDRMTANGKIHASSSVLLVDDGSHDSSWELIRQHHDKDDRIRGIKLSRNRGHQNALIAGLLSADGDAVVSVDADLQDDINAIESMIDEYNNGVDIVYGVRRNRDTDSIFKRSTAQGYYRILRLLGTSIVFNHADFRLLSRRTLESLKEYSEVNLFLRGIVPLLGYRTSIVTYDRSERFAGVSKYPLRKMLALAFDGVTSFSPAPLRIISATGFGVSLVSLGMMFWALYVRLFTDAGVPGWASSVVPIFFLGGVQLLSIGVLGEYVSKIYLETKRRPRYFIDEKI